jgi:hypothetical protein
VVLWPRRDETPQEGARQEVWLNVHARQIQDKRMREVYEKAARAGMAADRDALERENRRWD